MPGQSRPQPIVGQSPGDLAASATVQNKRTASVINVGAGSNGGVRTVTAATFISSTDSLVRGDTTSAGFTLTMPRVSEYPRNTWFIQRSAGANTLTLAARGSDTIDGAASITVTKMRKIFAVDNSSWITTVVEP